MSRTDVDATEPYGVALSFGRDQLRGELMGIAGNFQIRPDDFRERGYSLYVEYAPLTNLALGVSSLFTRATRDIFYGVADYRCANGPFFRYSPLEAVGSLAAVDTWYQWLTWNGHRAGVAGFTPLD